MDVLRHEGIKQIVVLLSDLDLNDFGLEDEVASYLHTPEETKDRGRKSHIPSVTTVPREGTVLSSDSQARWRPIAVRDAKWKTTDPLPAATSGVTTEAETSQTHSTPNSVGGTRSDDRSSPAAGQGSKLCSQPGAEVKPSPPDMVESRSSTQDVTGPSVAAKSDRNKTIPAEAEKKQTLDKPKPQVSATIKYQNFKPDPVQCHRCKKRRYPDADGYTRHNPRYCPGRKY